MLINLCQPVFDALFDALFDVLLLLLMDMAGGTGGVPGYLI